MKSVWLNSFAVCRINHTDSLWTKASLSVFCTLNVELINLIELDP